MKERAVNHKARAVLYALCALIFAANAVIFALRLHEPLVSAIWALGSVLQCVQFLREAKLAKKAAGNAAKDNDKPIL